MDNVYFSLGCPPKMQDGRYITDYQPKDTLDEYYQRTLAATDEHDYRLKLQQKGTQLLRDVVLTQVKSNTCKCNGNPCEINKK